MEPGTRKVQLSLETFAMLDPVIFHYFFPLFKLFYPTLILTQPDLFSLLAFCVLWVRNRILVIFHSQVFNQLPGLYGYSLNVYRMNEQMDALGIILPFSLLKSSFISLRYSCVHLKGRLRFSTVPVIKSIEPLPLGIYNSLASETQFLIHLKFIFSRT